MKRLFLTLCLVVFASPWVSAQDLTREERTHAADYLKKSSAAFTAATAGLSQAQLTFKPGPTRWSVAEVAEHIAATEDFLMEMIQEKVMPAPSRTEKVDLKELDDFVVRAIADRSSKAQAPDPLVPNNRFGSAAESVAHFKATRARAIAFLNETRDLRAHAIDSPLGKKLDGYQWLLFMAAHCERHTKQIDEVKADPKFPKT